MKIELAPAGAALRGHAAPIIWGGAGSNALRTPIDPWFSTWGRVAKPAMGMARVGTAVFLADRMTRRPARTLTRALDLIVHVPDPSAIRPAIQPLCELMHWITGDTWSIELVHDRTRPDTRPQRLRAAERVGLLSGGLDSFCGSVLSHTDDIVYLGHGDASNVRSAQDAVFAWYSDNGVELDRETVWLLPPTRAGKEASRRSRAAFFVLLAVALADASGATEIEIPENGFTSLNPPLGANRGGVWTTRSTHPHTIERLNAILATAGLGVTLVNPYETLTKGELVEAAASAARTAGLSNFASALAGTQSCAKADGRFYGGSPLDNCGLCFACVVRRGGVIHAVGSDPTRYLCDTLRKANRQELVDRRRPDINAITSFARRGVTRAQLVATGPFGAMTLDSAADLCARSAQELAGVPLP